MYHLTIDPGEDRDVKDQYPGVVAELTAIADQYRKTIGDGLTHQVGTEVRPAEAVDPQKK